MWYLVAIALVIVIVLFVKTKGADSSAAGGQELSAVSDTSPAQTVAATVVYKTISTQSQAKPTPTFYYTPTQNAPHNAKVFGVLTFQLETGKKKHFKVSERDFITVTEGDSGSLTFLGNHFIHFTHTEK